MSYPPDFDPKAEAIARWIFVAIAAVAIAILKCCTG